MTAPASVPRGSFHSVSQRRAWRRAGHLKERVLAVTGRGPRVGRRRPARRLPLRAPSTRQVSRRTTPKGVRRAGTVDGFSHTPRPAVSRGAFQVRSTPAEKYRPARKGTFKM